MRRGPDMRGDIQAAPDNGLHPTADTPVVINSQDAGRRVMPGVSQPDEAVWELP